MNTIGATSAAPPTSPKPPTTYSKKLFCNCPAASPVWHVAENVSSMCSDAKRAYCGAASRGGPLLIERLDRQGNICIFCNNRNNRHDKNSKNDAWHGRAKMSEPTKNSLTPVAQKFILHWGEMGTRWGINRTVAQVHALLFLAPQPLPADEISATLAVARSNVSTSLRELQGWRIVRVVHVLGDGREIFRIVSEERKRREIDPTLSVLAECVREVKSNPQGDAYTRERLESMLEFLTAMTGLFEEIIRMPTGALKGVVKLRGKVITLLGKKAVNG